MDAFFFPEIKFFASNVGSGAATVAVRARQEPSTNRKVGALASLQGPVTTKTTRPYASYGTTMMMIVVVVVVVVMMTMMMIHS